MGRVTSHGDDKRTTAHETWLQGRAASAIFCCGRRATTNSDECTSATNEKRRKIMDQATHNKIVSKISADIVEIEKEAEGLLDALLKGSPK
jgi:hypothetical protein